MEIFFGVQQSLIMPFFFNVFLYFLRDTEKKTACPIRDAFLFFLNF